MTVQQLPVETGVFARYLAELTGRIDRADGWYAIFLRRDPDGMRACLDGVEVPPWDVVESLLHDLAAVAGGVWTEREAARARSLHSAAAAAHDRLPGGRDALQERLELMLREEIHAKSRAEELLRLLAAVPPRGPEADRLTNELAWTRDDHARAMARVTELTARLAALPPPDPWPAPGWTPPDPATDAPPGPAPDHRVPRTAPGGAAPDPYRVRAGEDAAGSPVAPTGYPTRPAPAPGPGGGAWTGDPGYPARSGDEPRSASASDQAGRPGGGAWTGDPAGPAMPGDARSGGAGHPAPADPARGHASDGSGYGYAPDVSGGDPARDAPGRGRPQDAFGRSHASPTAGGHPDPTAKAVADTTPPPAPKKRRRRGGARFAGVEDDGGAADGVLGVPVLPVPEAGDVPRGARYGGAAAGPVEAPPSPEPPDVALRAARETVAALRSLRSAGLSGEAHVVLCEAAARPADWLPPLADELDRAGLAADRSTLLWEVASQPATRLAAAAELLDASGRAEDARQLLHQGVVRPAEEIADAVLALDDDGRPSRAAALLGAYVRARSAEDAARLGARDPGRLVPRLLDAAREVSASRERDLVHALRVAGHLGT
ncbi:hypothetical protein [Streptomyces sp. NPDC005805]|uniref:hypothetical protein n=1 Tax=Streptomyces sp. NPDC005805 TaxID=3157068 RepID=UPI0033E525EB